MARRRGQPFAARARKYSKRHRLASNRRPTPSLTSTSMGAERISLTVVIPAFNEQARLLSTLSILSECRRASGWDWELRVVDDGSTDETAAVAQSFAAAEPRTVVQ